MANRYLRPELTNEEVHEWFASVDGKVKSRPNFPAILFTGRGIVRKKTSTQSAENPSYCVAHGKDACFEDESTVYEDTLLESADMEQLDLETLPPLIDFSKYYDNPESLEVYRHYNFTHDYNPNLPTTEHRKKILAIIEQQPVSIIEGCTGSGKTTQIPQFILDEAARKEKYCNILVTQPRKIAAISIARRVSQERDWQVGGLVGYQVGLDKMTSPDTRITYVTTGVFLRRIIMSKSLNEFTHIILDEVHERDQETDLAMLLVRKLLNYNSKSVKVILMSATFDMNELSDYFGSCIYGKVIKAPTLKIAGEMFTVTEHYADELTPLGCPMPACDLANPEVLDEAYTLADKIIAHFDKLETGLQTPQATMSMDSSKRGSVLVFLPGIHEIRELERILKIEKENRRYQIIPLHSSITLEEQSLVFSKPKLGFRKIILSTNIAESSITVPDVKYVIDFCLTKCMVCDLDTNYQSLRLQWASKASGKQRSGRAGRVSNGKVYRLVSRNFWSTNIAEYGIPEMQRCSLESAILKVKLLGMGAPKSVLSLALSPPDLHNIGRTVLLLKEIGALSTTIEQKVYDGKLTFVGKVLAALPLDMRLGKLLILGYVFGCLDQCLIIAASLAKSSFLATPYYLELESFKQKLTWAKGSFSDCIAMLNAYQMWESCSRSSIFRRKSDEMDWGKKNFIQIRKVHDVHTLVDELRDRLSQFNIRSNDLCFWSSQGKKECELILKVIMSGAFYPNYFELLPSDGDVASKEMCLLDPTTTVMFRGFPPNCGGLLFKDSIIENTKGCGKAKKLYYDGSKAFIEFEKDTTIETKDVYPAVYLASRLSNSMRPLQFFKSYELAPENNDSKIFLYEDAQKKRYRQEVMKPSGMVWFPIFVTHINSVSCFWGYKALSKNNEIMDTIENMVADCYARYSTTEVIPVMDKLFLIALTYNNVTQHYRAVITRITPSISVWCVDYGNSVYNVDICSLCKVSPQLEQIPFQAIAFRMRGVQQLEYVPALKTKSFILEAVQSSKGIMMAKVYSVSAGTVNVDLFTKDDRYINELLVTNGLCEFANESKVSEISHKSWKMAEEEHVVDEELFAQKHPGMWHELDQSIRVPTKRKLHYQRIHGPRSPFEGSFSSLMKVGRCRKVRVDRNSINSFAINLSREKTGGSVMMSAAEIGINQSGTTMLARSTTMLPSINGLRSLLLLIFCPIMELRVDVEEQHYTGAICGLGAAKMCNGEWRSILPDHDIEVVFDTKITSQDVIDVNSIRMMINMAVGSQESILGGQAIHRLQGNARKKLLDLISKERQLITQDNMMHSYKWRLNPKSKIVPHHISDSEADKKDFYRLHDGVLLKQTKKPNPYQPSYM
nr:ATP-dependent RNA helicase TDRD9-like [Ciona intestinalis]XP_026694369.1 ATP-dependent RNA helicase TDRD9-like [Ciona intestinalis]|eukprot:XP_026694368.1 ATP-dependent RNA helicase TDRD9-like [Ciona intestinalis]